MADNLTQILGITAVSDLIHSLKSKIPVIPSVIHHSQKPLESTYPNFLKGGSLLANILAGTLGIKS
jgi:hypothetical protein